MWKTNWSKFLKDLEGIPSRVDANEIFPAATEGMVQELEKKIGQRLPPLFRGFLLNESAGIDVSWNLDEGVLIKLEGEKESIYAGALTFHVDDILHQNPRFQGERGGDDDPEYCPADLLAFSSTPNGDQFAVVLTGPEQDAIKYLSHDLEEIHLFKAGTDLASFLTNFARLGFVGAEYWVWEPFTNGKTTPIDSTSTRAREFLEALRHGRRSADAEGEQKRADEASRLVHYEHIVLPEANRLWEAKDFERFARTVSKYADLFSSSMKAKYGYALKQKAGRSRPPSS